METRFPLGCPRRPASAPARTALRRCFHHELDALSVPSCFVSARAIAAESYKTSGAKPPAPGGVVLRSAPLLSATRPVRLLG